MKSFLFVLESAPYSGSHTQESLDVILISAAFDQEVSLLLLDSSIFHLKKNQNTAGLSCKNIGAIYRSLALYDVEEIYVEEDSLLRLGLRESDLLMPVKVLKKHEVSPFMKKFNFVLNA